LASTLTDGSGVSTCTAPSVWFQYSHTASSAPRAAMVPRSAAPSCRPHRHRADAEAENDLALLPAASSKLTWIAAQGSRPAPTLPESRDRFMAAGLRSGRLRR